VGAVGAHAADPPALGAYVEQALRANLGLEQRRLEERAAASRLDEARSLYRPTIALQARYSRADGGRAIEFPVGDLLNPVFDTLDELLAAGGQPPRFGPLDNVEIPFLREREHDTRLRLSQPVYRRDLDANRAASRHQLEASGHARRAFERRLVRDVRAAYWAHCGALGVLDVLAATRELVNESLRVSESRFERGALTEDEVLRDRAELAGVEQSLREAERGREATRDVIDFLLDRAPGSPVDTSGCEAESGGGGVAAAAAGAGAIEASGGEAAKVSTTRASLAARSELAQLDAAVAASRSGVDATRAESWPALGFALDYGAEGESYDFDESFWQASLVLSWNVFTSGRTKARRETARLEAESLERRREELARQLTLEARDAIESLETARFEVKATDRRQRAAQEAYRIVERRYEAGAVPLVSLTDARRELTDAGIARRLAAFRVRTAEAELERVLETDPWTSELSSESEEQGGEP
jgi:outer membrane protein